MVHPALPPPLGLLGKQKVPKDSSLGRWPFSLLSLIQPYRQILLGCMCKDTTAPKPDPSTSALQVCFPENEVCYFSESWDVQRTHGTPDRMTKGKALPDLYITRLSPSERLFPLSTSAPISPSSFTPDHRWGRWQERERASFYGAVMQSHKVCPVGKNWGFSKGQGGSASGHQVRSLGKGRGRRKGPTKAWETGQPLPELLNCMSNSRAGGKGNSGSSVQQKQFLVRWSEGY